MCGIIGVLNREPNRNVDIQNALGILNHRGPNDRGIWRDPHIVLGHTRLSILDLSPLGHQPMSFQNERFWITFNGEIYNYLELRQELMGVGYQFISQSDTEVLLAAYAEWGKACLERLRGMFVFGIWDTAQKTLFLARDRCGEKPLYYQYNHQSLFFASELKSILALLPEIPELNSEAIDLYLHYQYVPEPQTPLSGIFKLPAAHYLFIDYTNWTMNLKRYWSFHDVPPIVNGDITEALREELHQAIALTLRSDVPVGVALSGGLDSGAITLLAAPEYKETLQTFSVGYPGYPAHDERREAQKLASQMGLPFWDIELRTEDFVQFFPSLVATMDDPIADIAAYGHYAVMKLAAERGVKVMLTGIGGDELFWGYPWVALAARLTERKQQLLKIPHVSHKLWSLLARVVNTSFVHKVLIHRQTPKFFRKGLAVNTLTLDHPDQAIFYDLVPDFVQGLNVLNGLYTDDFKGLLSGRNPYRPFEVCLDDTESVPLKICQFIFETWLASNCLALGDRVSMASSVETRLPLLDYKFIELIMGFRKTHPDHNLEHKFWLTSALKGLVSDDMFSRPKRGFEPPTQEWINAINQRYYHILHESSLVQLGVFRDQSLGRLRNQAIDSHQHSFLLYKILLLEIWYRKVVVQESL